jgi:hypothetical protein
MTSRPTILPTVSAALFALASLIDISFLSVVGSPDAAPLPALILIALLCVGTLAALVPARHRRPALITAIVLRVLSALLAVVSFFAGAPVWVQASEGVVIASTVIALALIRRRPAVAVAP